MVGTPFAAKGLVSGILRQQAGEIGFRSEVARRGETVQGEEVAPGAFQRIIPLVANVGETGATHASGLGKERDQVRGEIIGKVAGLHAAVVKMVSDRTRFADLLAQVDLALEALRGEGGNVKTVVVEEGEDQLEVFAVE